MLDTFDFLETLKTAPLVLGGTFGERDDSLSYQILDAFASYGGKAIDTANVYADGNSERLLGNWFKAKKNRERIILLDKGCHARLDNKPRVNAQAINDDLEESLMRLQTEYIDIYFLHRDDEESPIEPLIVKLNQEIESGRIRSFGASNWCSHRIRQSNEFAKKNNLRGFTASSCSLSLAIPNEPMWPGSVYVDEEMKKWHEQTGMPLFSWSSQAKGWFSGKFVNGKYKHSDICRVYDSPVNRERLSRAEKIGKQKSATAMQIALSYVLNQSFPVFPLIGSENVGELEESFEALQLLLNSEEIDYLEKG
jgi:1-deoxyxylulose-5-phosphate synthase